MVPCGLFSETVEHRCVWGTVCEILEFQQNEEVEVSKYFYFEEASFDISSAVFHFSRSQEPSHMTTSKARYIVRIQLFIRISHCVTGKTCSAA
jgi:hypothetical protein